LHEFKGLEIPQAPVSTDKLVQLVTTAIVVVVEDCFVFYWLRDHEKCVSYAKSSCGRNTDQKWGRWAQVRVSVAL